jgi:CRISPR-associated endonuclease Csn1
MFSQRNNPYCDLLSDTNILQKPQNMKKILGLDLGTNSIGWALIDQNFEEKQGDILGLGSRIIPMAQDAIDAFGDGITQSQTAERTRLRGVRRIKERHLLRRERLHRVLNLLGFLPTHYSNNIDFEKRLGKFLPETETKFAYNDDGNFIFKSSFNEMLADFERYQPELVNRKNKKGENAKIPYDWTIYYLRKKALSQKLENEELAWLLLHFNQKRGYYQLRGEENEEKNSKTEEFYSLKVTDVTADAPQKGKSEIWYNIILENGWIYRRASKTPLFDWKNKIRDFIVSTDVNEDGSVKTDKEGKEKRSFRSPKEDDWQLLKKKTENEIDKSRKTVGEYIYAALLQNPNIKIKGKLVRTIERKFYKQELEAILRKQVGLNPDLQNKSNYTLCIEHLYPHNINHQSTLATKDFIHLFIEDILFYQRPLRSQKSSISNCTLETRSYTHEGILKSEAIKCAPKSHPLYQEFRLWQWISNLRIYSRLNDNDITGTLLSSTDDYAMLYEFLSSKKEINQKALLAYLKKAKLKDTTHRWNYVEDKDYPCFETMTMIATRLQKVTNAPANFLTQQKTEELWHIIYSVTDKTEYEKALNSFSLKNNLDTTSFIDSFRKFPPFPSDYGAYSLKAIKKLLPLMRAGKYWNENQINANTRDRIEKILNAEVDASIQDRVREQTINRTHITHYQALPEWLAKYVVYNRHAERSDTGKWNSVADLDTFIRNFRQHSLRNPIVEQVLTETLRVVRDIWQHYGNGAPDFFTEIHLELGREMKNPADKRKQLTENITRNENTNLRIKALLAQMAADNTADNVRPYSPMQQDILKIYEEGVLNSNIEIPDDISKISKLAQPSSADMMRYKQWLEQKYRSPYTGDIIPLSKLFTPAYEIEHIIPQSRYFDDSFNNKIICESAVNKLKDQQTALEFIQNHPGQKVELGMGKTTKIFSVEEYTLFVQDHYGKNRTKRNNLLSVDVPEKMIERQLNDTRYVSKYVMQLLSNLVRQQNNDDGVNAKNIIACNGQITSKLKQDWGLDGVWNDLILPRFERLNAITNSTHFTTYSDRHQKMLPTVPLELQKGFQKKRIDHRHHALDALVIACATRSHINYLNNQNALDKRKSKEEKQNERYDLKLSLCHKKYNDNSKDNYNWVFKQPWSSFVLDTKNHLESVVVSFKQNLRIINKTVNYSERYVDGKKTLIKQDKGTNWAIRKPLHKDTVSGLVSLQKIKEVSISAAIDQPQNITDKTIRAYISKLIAEGYDKKKLTKHLKECNYQIGDINASRVLIRYIDNLNVASRTTLDTSFTPDRIRNTVTDTGIQKILLTHLQQHQDNPETAFTPEGIEDMNRNIVSLNNGNFHKPILKIRTYEPQGNKFQIGTTGNKSHKFVEAAKGTNLFFAIYADKDGKRSYETIPLHIVIERQKQGYSPVPDINEDGYNLLFTLSPNDLVLIPDSINNNLIDLDKNKSNIYKIVSFTGNRLYGIPCNNSVPIYDKIEYSQLNKMETTIDRISIKEHCLKISIDRIGYTRPSLP